MIFLYFILGSIFGSFYNVVIFRLPKNLSIITPRSHCFNCKKTIPFYLNIPILSYLICRGNCFYCKSKISVQYILIEISTGILWSYGFLNYNFETAILFLWITGILSIIAAIDFKYYIIPTSLIFLAFFGLIIYNIIYSANLKDSIVGLLFGLSYLGGTAFITSKIFKKQTLGFGDILLIIILGTWLGLIKVAITIFLSAVIALIVWIMLSIKKGFKINYKLPFGFYLSITSIIVYILKFDYNLFF